PDYFGAHLNIGNIQMQRGDFHEAVQAYERSVTLGPRDALARYSLGAALARVERWEEAVTRYTESLDLGLDPALSANAELGLGLALIRLERTAEAIPHMEAALAARPSDAESHGGLALLLLARGESGKAARHFEQALATRPDDPEALNGLAWIRATAGSPADRDGAKAIQLAGRAVELTGRRNAYYLDTLAAALAAVDSLDAAVATAREALELARAEGNASLASEIEFHLSRYQQGN
ncbi:MAG: serine/threonine protein kinase, partial [bacterium]